MASTSAALRVCRSRNVIPARFTSRAPEIPGYARRSELQPVLPDPRAVDLQDFDVDDDLRPRLVEGGDEPPRGEKPFGRITDKNRVQFRDGRDVSQIADDPQRVHGLFQVHVLDDDGAEDVFLVVASLGRRIRHDDDRRGRRDLVERAGGLGDDVERLPERQAAQQAHLRRGLVKLRVERDADVRELRNRDVEQPAGHARAGGNLGRRFRIGQLVTGRRQFPRPREHRLEPCLSLRRAELRAERRPHGTEVVLSLRVRRVELDRQLKLDDRIVVAALGEEAASAEQVRVRRTELGPVEAEHGFFIVGVLGNRLLVLPSERWYSRAHRLAAPSSWSRGAARDVDENCDAHDGAGSAKANH